MSTIGIINSSTRGRKIVGAVAAAAAIVGIYAGCVWTNSYMNTKNGKEKIKQAEEYVKKGDYKTAGDIISICEKGNLTFTAECARLRRDIAEKVRSSEIQNEKKNDSRKIEEMIKTNDLDGARKSVAELSKDGKYTLDEIKGLENRIQENTEEGMFSKIKSGPFWEREGICVSYLNKYKSGKYVDKAWSELIINQATRLYEYALGKVEFSKVEDSLDVLGHNLNEITNMTVFVSDRISFDIIAKECRNYISSTNEVQKADTSGELKVGKRVRVSKPSQEGFLKEYYDEREKSIPANSLGEILGISGNGQIEIYFPEVHRTYWKKDWNGKSMTSMNKDGKAIAWYHANELTIASLVKVNELESYRFGKKIEKLEELSKNCK